MSYGYSGNYRRGYGAGGGQALAPVGQAFVTMRQVGAERLFTLNIGGVEKPVYFGKAA